MFYQWFSFKKQSHLLSNLDSFFLTMVLSRHVLSYRIPWCYRTMSQSYLSPWCYRTMASSYLILFLTHPTFVIVPWNIYHTKIYCKWTSLFDRAYRANLRPEKVIYYLQEPLHLTEYDQAKDIVVIYCTHLMRVKYSKNLIIFSQVML